MIAEKTKTIDPLEPFLLLGKNVRGAAASQLVQQVTEAPNVFVFGELLQLDGIKELENNETHSQYWRLLQLYAFGVYKDFQEKKESLPELNDAQIRKLRLLTLATLASKSKFVYYDSLKSSLGLDNLRQLEDLIIEAIYADILQGKINQKEKRLEVDFVVGRDIKPEMIETIIDTLQNWSAKCEAAMVNLDVQSSRANVNKESKAQHRKDIENNIESMKKIHRAQDMQQVLEPESSGSPVARNQKMKASSKTIMKSAVKPSTSRTK